LCLLSIDILLQAAKLLKSILGRLLPFMEPAVNPLVQALRDGMPTKDIRSLITPENVNAVGPDGSFYFSPSYLVHPRV
jgi:hypothetical protein